MIMMMNSSFLIFLFLLMLTPGSSSVTANLTMRTNSSSSCKHHDDWPSVDFLLPVGLSATNHERNSEWSDVVFHTMKLFWPLEKMKHHSRLILVVDEEVKGSELVKHYVLDVIEKNRDVMNITVAYHHMRVPLKGHDRQQNLMFWADNYTSAEYVGFLDTDTVFITSVFVGDFFENNKAIIHGRFFQYKKKHRYMNEWPMSTYRALQEEEPLMCMSYFPVIFKVQHFPGMRKRMEETIKMPFDEAFATVANTNQYSQFNIMCTYAFWHAKEEYTWHIRDLSPEWDGFHPAPIFGQWGDRSVFQPGMLSIRPAVAVHLRYRFSITFPLVGHNNLNLHKLTLQGMCHSPNFHAFFAHEEALKGALLMQNNITVEEKKQSAQPPDESAKLHHHLCANYLTKSLAYFQDMYIFENGDCTLVLNETELVRLYETRKQCTPHALSPIAKSEFLQTYASYSIDQLEDWLVARPRH